MAINEGSETDAPVKNTVSSASEKVAPTAQAKGQTWQEAAKEEIARNHYQKDEDVLAALYRARSKSQEGQPVKVETVSGEDFVVNTEGQLAVDDASINEEVSEGEVTDESVQTDDESTVEAEDADVEEAGNETESNEELAEGDYLIKKALKKPLKQLDKKTREAALLQQELFKQRQEIEELKRNSNNQMARDQRASLGEYERRIDLDGLVQEQSSLTQARRNLQNLLLGRDKQDSEGHEYLTVLKDGTKITREQAIQWKNDLDTRIEEQIPKRINTLRQSREMKTVVTNRIREVYPWANDATDSKYLEMQGFLSNPKYGYLLEENPELQMLVAAGLNDLQRVVSSSTAKKIVSKAKPVASKPLKSTAGQTAGVTSDTSKSAVMVAHQKLVDAVKSASPRDQIDALAKLSVFRKQHRIGVVK